MAKINQTEDMFFGTRNSNCKTNFKKHISYWRSNIHRFAEEYLGLNLYPFQKLILYGLNMPVLSKAILFASRGLGKTFIVAVFVICKCILYPGTKVVVASPNKKQSSSFIKVIRELARDYPNIEVSIEGGVNGVKISKEDARLTFKGGSAVISKTANEGARGERCQILILDEFIWMDKNIVSDVLTKFLTALRRPKYLKKKEYAHLIDKENNVRIALSSVDTVTDWGYIDFKDYCDYIANGDTEYFVASLPYQLGVESGIIDKRLIAGEIKEGKTSLDGFKKEMEVIPYGENENALFKYSELERARNLEIPLVPITNEEFIAYNGDISKAPLYRKKPQVDNYYRIMAVDIAVSARKEADNSVIMVGDAIPNNRNEYNADIRFCEVPDCTDIAPQALRIKQAFYDMECDYIIIDCNGALGLNIYSLLQQPIFDEARGITYPAWGRCSMSPDISENADLEGCDKVVYGIKVAGAGASDLIYGMSVKAKLAFELKKIGLLIDSESAVDVLDKRSNFAKLKYSNDEHDKELALRLISSFENIDELIEESIRTKLIKLPSGRWSIEKGDVRKDRVITFLYFMYFVNLLEEDLKVIGSRITYQSILEAHKNASIGSNSLTNYRPVKAVNGMPQRQSRNPFASRSNPFARKG